MRKVCYILLCCVLLGLTACQDKGIDVGGQGRIRLSITDRVMSKALPDALTPELTDQFRVTMIRQEDNHLVFGGTCADFNAKPQLFRCGEHTLQVSYGDNPLLAMDAPYYVSEEKTVVVEAGKEQEVVVQCRVGNALASFEFLNADKLDKVLKDYYIELVVKGESLKWNPESSEHPYIKAGSEVEFYLKGTWIENGLSYARKFASVMPVEAGKRYHYKLTFDTSNMTGTILDIEVEAVVDTITVNETLPQEWLPKPKITAEGFDENNLLTYTETEEAKTAVINYAAVRPVQDVEMTLNFADPNLSILNKTYVLSTITEEDRQALQNAAIVLPTLDQVATMGKIDFTEMTSSLLTKDGGLDADNQFQVRVKANERWSDKVDYTVKTIKPEFSIGVYPGNIWTKEFTINPLSADSVKTGNINKFKEITYEFSVDGENWIVMADNLRKDCLVPGVTYYIRPKYRGQVPGKVSEITTYPTIELENGGLENWTNFNGGKESGSIGNYGAQYEWTGWATINALTCDYAAGVAAACNSRSGTRPVTGDNAYSGTAAWIVTMGYGYGAWIGNYKYTTTSELFLGSVTDVDHNSDVCTKNYGIEYGSHPTGVFFYYKYLPYGDDKSDIYIQVLSDDTVIGSGTLNQSERVDNYTGYLLPIQYDAQYINLKPNRLILVFRSGFSTSVRQIGSNTTAAPRYQGSSLYIDEIQLIYEK